jgi:hypothetical protein
MLYNGIILWQNLKPLLLIKFLIIDVKKEERKMKFS